MALTTETTRCDNEEAQAALTAEPSRRRKAATRHDTEQGSVGQSGSGTKRSGMGRKREGAGGRGQVDGEAQRGQRQQRARRPCKKLTPRRMFFRQSY
ncbi:hypothetical protein GUJ93_ZPchr0006g43627 [Zizania palustris]|uniref:Uncharacterized protein n=1 Tax=Zizania palustris TaxID=103762 RepID=A0A8J5SQR2_ZIZPA|nr:hypothetical protein GUJ93_ZPchr0006g43627 [Zizania palustris]